MPKCLPSISTDLLVFLSCRVLAMVLTICSTSFGTISKVPRRWSSGGLIYLIAFEQRFPAITREKLTTLESIRY